MKFTCEISKPTQLDDKIVVERVLAILKEKRYAIVKLTPTAVSFDMHNGGYRLGPEYISLFVSGDFIIDYKNGIKIVRLKYTPIDSFDILVFVISTALFIAIAVFIKADVVLLAALPFAGRLCYQYFKLRHIAKDYLNRATE